MPFTEKYPIETKYIPKPSRRRSGISIQKVRFLVAHDTGNPGSSANSNVQWYIDTCQTVEKDKVSSAHLFVDDHHIVECITALTGPPEKAWHVLYKKTKDNELYGANANDAAIGVEYCYGGGIDAGKAYDRYVWLLAKLCYQFKLNPQTDVVGHFILDPERKTDPRTGLLASGRTYQQLLLDVVTAYHSNIQGDAIAQPAVAKVKTAIPLNLRAHPNKSATLVKTVPADTELLYVDRTLTGEAVRGNSIWYKTQEGNWFWDGGLIH